MQFTLGKSKLKLLHVSVLTVALQLVPSWSNAGTETSAELKSAAADGFRLSLPSGWREIPKAGVINQNAKMRNLGVESFNSVAYAAQPEKNRIWFSYPTISVIVDRNGPISSERFAHAAERLRNQAAATALFATQASAGRVKNAAMGADAEFDKTRNVLSWSSSMNHVGYGLVNAYTELVPTKYGYINLTGVSLASEQSPDATKAAYRAAFRTLRLSDSVAVDGKRK